MPGEREEEIFEACVVCNVVGELKVQTIDNGRNSEVI